MDEQAAPEPSVTSTANIVANKIDADVLMYNGGIERPHAQGIIELLAKHRLRKNILLLLVTEGGDADAAYRIAKHLQLNYEVFYVLISGYCKSAGTLVALGANVIIMGESGELGPLDVQLAKQDSLMEQRSGLTVNKALDELKRQAFKWYEHYLLEIQRRSGGRITVKTASETAVKLVAGILAPISSQIDPMHIGEAQRINDLAYHYGKRLNLRANNLKSHEALVALAKAFPSHGFVIDSDDVSALFNNVYPASVEIINLLRCLGREAIEPAQEDIIKFLSDEVADVSEDSKAVENEKNDPKGGVNDGDERADDDKVKAPEKPGRDNKRNMEDHRIGTKETAKA